AMQEHDLKTILLLDYGKNLYAYWQAARDLGLEIVAIADNSLAGPKHQYRGIPIVDDTAARALHFDAAVIANLSPVHARRRTAEWGHMDIRPTIDLFADNQTLRRYSTPTHAHAATA